MQYSYEFTEPFGDAFMTAFAAFYGIALLLCVALGIAAYVMQSFALHSIARRRGLNHPWLAWLPIGCEWILGSISDQYQYLVRNQIRSRRKVMLGLSIASTLVGAVTLVLAVSLLVNILGAPYYAADGMIAYALGWQMTGLVIACVILLVVSVVGLVFWYMAMYDLFRSCDPNNAVAYLVLGIIGRFGQSLIVFAALLEPIFLLICRKKDDGMPPRRDVPPVQPQTFYEPPRPMDPWEEE